MAKEIEIEVFRVGGAASRHVTAEHIAEVATFDAEAAPVPVCFGHPKSDTPAAGTISKLRAEGNSLFATVSAFTDKAIEGIKSGDWINRSMAFFDPTHEANPRPGKWSPRHLGLLGGAAPGIPGMTPLSKALAFDAAEDSVVVDGDPADAVVYGTPPKGTAVHFVSSEEPTDVTTTNPQTTTSGEFTAADLDAREAKIAEREQAAAKRVRTQFEASNGSAIDALVASGKVMPAEAEGLKLAFNALDPEGDLLTFGAGDKATSATAVSHILSFMASAIDKRAPIDTTRTSPSAQFDARPASEMSPEEMGNKARQMMKDKPGLTFEAAIEAVEAGRA